MTDLPDSAADRAANAQTPDLETPGGDPELAALVRRDPPPEDAGPADAPDLDEPDTAVADMSAISEDGVDAVPVLSLAAVVTEGDPPARPRPRHLGAARRGIRGRPPGGAAREPDRRTAGRDSRRDPRLGRRLRPRQAGGRRRDACDDDRRDPGRRLCVGSRRDVQRLPGEK